MKAVHIGPGNIGRGLIGELLHISGYYIVFLGVNPEKVATLNREKSYQITHASGSGSYATKVSGFCGASILQEEHAATRHIATADILTCSVGAENLEHIASVIAGGLARRNPALPPIAVIACENLLHASEVLARQVGDFQSKSGGLYSDYGKAVYANSMVDCIIPTQDPGSSLNVKVEAYREWVVDSTTFTLHSAPHIAGVTWVLDLEPYIERKLFSVNTAHAAAAYFGYQQGFTTIQQAMGHPEILQQVTQALRETGTLLTEKHQFSPPEHEKYISTTIARISNPHLTDTITRVGRSPARKLGRYERFIDPAAQLDSLGKPIEALLAAVEKAFQFQDVPGDAESASLAEIIRTKQPPEIAAAICGLTPGTRLHQRVATIVAKLQSVVG
jgi:mannitol-1-phosphate 5-dehydrogenase